MTVYFLSDLHWGHAKIAELRGFDSVDDHDQHILDTLASTLHSGDQLWNLGDLTIGGRRAEDAALSHIATLNRLGVENHLIPGNHDSCHPMANRASHNRLRAFLQVFESVQLTARRRIHNQTVLLSHFPMLGGGDHRDVERGTNFRIADDGQVLVLHGHTHSPDVLSAAPADQDAAPGTRPRRQIHCGWDAWKRPVPLHEIEDLIATELAVAA